MPLPSYCPYCGDRVHGTYASAGTCVGCNREIFANSRPAAGVFICRGEKVLLVQRGVEPAKGKWDIPGGFLEEGESAEDGACREVMEELGYELFHDDLLLVSTQVNPWPAGAVLDVLFEAEAPPGEPRVDSDVSACCWFPIDNFPDDIAFEASRVALERWRFLRKDRKTRRTGGAWRRPALTSFWKIRDGHLVTGRRESLLAADVRTHAAELEERLRGRRVAVIGAAGSIGSGVVESLLPWRPECLVLIDLNENELVEIVRDLRSRPQGILPKELATLPLGLGSWELDRYFSETQPFDFIFNLCALKHVRSEKDIFSIARMLETNVIFLHRLMSNYIPQTAKFFSVSSDKAANPSNLLGASKLLMEMVLASHSLEHRASSARFANVAFSSGSLLHGFLRRIEKKQPLSGPSDVRRFFISHEEAAHLCLLSGILGESGDVLIPNLDPESHQRTFPEIATAMLADIGYEPMFCDSETEAKARISEGLADGRWPCVFLPSDTSGEKIVEEVHTEREQVDFERFQGAGVLQRSFCEGDRRVVDRVVELVERLRMDPTVTKGDVIKALSELLPTFQHLEKGRSLDQKM